MRNLPPSQHVYLLSVSDILGSDTEMLRVEVATELSFVKKYS